MNRVFAVSAGIALALSIVAASTAAAQGGVSRANKTYNGSSVKFSYPAGWNPLTKAQKQSMANGFASNAKDYTSVSVGGVYKKVHKTAGVTAFIKILFTRNFQKKLKGHEALFVDKAVQGASSGAKVVGRGSATFGGRPGKMIEVVTKGKKNHIKFYVSLPAGDKFGQMGVLVAAPASAWGAFGGAMTKMAHTVRFK